jgi:hypothetical protein
METKKCRDCGLEKSVEDFYRHKTGRDAGGYVSYCKQCCSRRYKQRYGPGSRTDEQRRYRQSLPEEEKERRRVLHREVTNRATRRLKLEVIKTYGGACSICGQSQLEFLTLDHSFGDGGVIRKELKGNSVYKDLKKRGYPKDEGIRVLCWNCNCSLGLYGYVPTGG